MTRKPFKFISLLIAALGFAIMQSGSQKPELEAEVELHGGATMEMVWIPPGTSIMGKPNKECPECPPHDITISRGFYLGKYELTQA